MISISKGKKDIANSSLVLSAMDQLMKSPSSSSKTERRITERNRRNQMKALYSTLHSLLPHQPSKEVKSLVDQLDNAVNYIKSLQMGLKTMRNKKNSLTLQVKRQKIADNGKMRLPQVEIHEMESTLEIVLITGLDSRFIFTHILWLLQQMEVEVLTATFSVVEHKVFHTIRSKIGDSHTKSAEFTRISEMVKQVVNNS